MNADVVVLGGGAAGVAAALAARAAGASVSLLRRAPGATALSSGALDLAADPLEAAGEAWCDRPAVREAYARLLRAEPDHPLGVARLDGEQVAAVLTQACAALGLDPPRQLDQPPLVLATDQGTFKSTCGATSAAAAGHLPGLAGGRVGVLGLRHHPAYDTASRAPAYARLATRGGVQAEFLPVTVDLLRHRGDVHMPPHELALELERPEPLERLADALSRAVQRHALTHLLLPPVMGLHRHPEVMRRLGELGAKVAEILGSPPAVPGLRLQRRLEDALDRQRIELLTGRAVGHHGEGDALRSIRLEDGLELSAGAFVLATGKFIGGGLSHGPRLRESLFDLPVWVDRDAPNPAYLGQYMARDVAGPHPLMAAGLRVDQALRPLAIGGRAAWSNLRAAGSVIGGYDYIAGRSGLGTAIVTGWLAGSGAAKAGRGTP